MSHRVQLQPAFILHTRAFRDTSKIVEAITPEYGRVSFVAKGVKSSGRSQKSSLLQPFIPVVISWSGQGEMFTLTGVEPNGMPYDIVGRRIFSGFYLNELLLYLLHRHDPAPEIFQSYQNALYALSKNGDEEWLLRKFEYELLSSTGYGLELSALADTGESIEPDVLYEYHVGKGLFPLVGEHAGERSVPIHGSSIKALLQPAPGTDTEQAKKEIKRLMRVVLDYHLDGKPLRSRELYRQSQSLTASGKS